LLPAAVLATLAVVGAAITAPTAAAACLTIPGSPANVTICDANASDSGGLGGAVLQEAVGAIPQRPCCTFRDVMIAGGGNRSISSGLASDVVVAGGSNNAVSGGGGADVMVAGGSNSTVTGGPGKDVVVAGPGNDVVEGDPGVAGCSGGIDLVIIVLC
jgi:Ca2+-binding RTX toxin-like protein